eukprot:scaffold1724_cov341-Pavlova_lutheri.AAC.75
MERLRGVERERERERDVCVSRSHVEAHAYVHGGQFARQVPEHVGDGGVDDVLGSPTHQTGLLERHPCTRSTWSRWCGDGSRPRGQHAPTTTTDAGHVVVGRGVQAVVEQEGSAVRQQRIPLHLSEADAAAQLASLDRLSRQRIHRSSRTHLKLVRYHVTKPLVIHQTHEDVALELLARHAADHGLGAVIGVTTLQELLAELVHDAKAMAIRGTPVETVRLLLGRAERSGVHETAVHGARLGSHALQEHANGHA